MRGDEVLELHDHAVERTAQEGIGLSAVLLSNGVVLREPLARGLLQRGIKVMISLDGIGEAHDELRPTVSGRRTSAMVERTIDGLVRLGLRPQSRSRSRVATWPRSPTSCASRSPGT